MSSLFLSSDEASWVKRQEHTLLICGCKLSYSGELFFSNFGVFLIWMHFTLFFFF